MNKIKKNWKQIAFALVCCFALNKCTVSCNRQIEIDRLNAEIEVRDSIVNAQTDMIDSITELSQRQQIRIELLNQSAASNAEMQRQKFLLDSLDRMNQQKQANELKKLNQHLKEVSANNQNNQNNK